MCFKTVEEEEKGEDVQITKRRLLQERATVDTDGWKLTDDAAESFKVFEEDTGDDDWDQSREDTRIGFASRFRNGLYDEQDLDDEVYHDLYQQTYDLDDEWDDEDFESGTTTSSNLKSFWL